MQTCWEYTQRSASFKHVIQPKPQEKNNRSTNSDMHGNCSSYPSSDLTWRTVICTEEFSEVAFVPFGLKQSLKLLLSFLLDVIVAIGGALVNFRNTYHPSDTNRSCKIKIKWVNRLLADRDSRSVHAQCSAGDKQHSLLYTIRALKYFLPLVRGALALPLVNNCPQSLHYSRSLAQVLTYPHPALSWAGRDHLQRSPPPNYSVFCHLLGCKAPGVVLSKQEHSTTDLCSARTPEKHGLSQATVCAGQSTEKAASKFTETYNPLLVREWKRKQLGPVKGFAHKQKEEKHLWRLKGHELGKTKGGPNRQPAAWDPSGAVSMKTLRLEPEGYKLHLERDAEHK